MFKNLTIVIALLSLGPLSACSSKPIIPKGEDIKVSRETPNTSCKDLGTLTGKTLYATGTKEDALKDLREQAANKGADYIQIKSFSDTGTAVTGILFECP